jgi:hypothetical protein
MQPRALKFGRESPFGISDLRVASNLLRYSIHFGSIGCVAMISFSCLMPGCATKRYTSTSDLWRAQELRQQRVAREAGRIGYIGNAGPALGTTFAPSSH